MDNTTEAMSVETPHTQVMTRIGFAERWLHRARAQCADGDVAGGLMTLSLADAEVRVALEAGGWPMPRPAVPRPALHRWFPWVMLAAAAAVASVWMFRPASAPAAAVTDGPPVVRFSSQVGTMLSLVSVTPVQSAPVQVARPDGPPRARRIAARTPRPAGSSQPRTAAAAPAPAASSAVTAAVRPLPTTAPVPEATPNPAAPFVLSEVDLMEMVLAANQALRGPGP